MADEAILLKFDAELRRGALVLAVLSRLTDWEYGYSLRQALEGAGLAIEEGTLYPLLRRLESQGALESSWNTDGSSPRRYYRRSATGDQVFEVLRDGWRRQASVMEKLLEDPVEGDGNGRR